MEGVGRLEGLHCSVGDASSRWSQMCWSWYFPRFLLRAGSWMHMNMASLMVLKWLLTSLCTILNCSGSMGCPVMVVCRWMGEGALRCFDSFSQWSAWFSYVSTGAVYLGALVVVDDACLVVLGVLVLGVPKNVLSVLVPLKCTWIPLLLHSFLNFSPVPGM